MESFEFSPPRVAIGERELLKLMRNVYLASDGFYIDVVNFAAGHVGMLNTLEWQGGLLTLNFGMGRGAFGAGHGEGALRLQ